MGSSCQFPVHHSAWLHACMGGTQIKHRKHTTAAPGMRQTLGPIAICDPRRTPIVCSWPCPLPIILLYWITSSFLHLYIHGQEASKGHHLQLRKQSIANTNQSFQFQAKGKKEVTMITTKRRIAQLAKKWQRMAALGRKRLSWRVAKEADECCTSVAGKGHCVVYTADEKRFEVPLVYLSTPVFAELLRMSQEEFRFMSNGRITLPCDAAIMEYAMCLLRRGSSAEVEKAFLSTMAASCHYATCVVPPTGVSHQVAVCSS